MSVADDAKGTEGEKGRLRMLQNSEELRVMLFREKSERKEGRGWQDGGSLRTTVGAV